MREDPKQVPWPCRGQLPDCLPLPTRLLSFSRWAPDLGPLTCLVPRPPPATSLLPFSPQLSEICAWTSLVAQWLRVCLPMQGTRVRALVWEDPTCRGATGPVSHNC